MIHLRSVFVVPFVVFALPLSAQLRTMSLQDGTGSVGLPTGWTMQGSDHGQVSANDAANDSINLGMPWTILDPRSSAASFRAPYPTPKAMPGDLIGGLRSVLSEVAHARLVSAKVKRIQGVNGAPAAMILYEFTAGGQTYASLGYFAALVYPGAPNWRLYNSAVVARKDRFNQQLSTLMAIWKSWRPNGQKPTEGSASAVADEILAHRKASFEEMQRKFNDPL